MKRHVILWALLGTAALLALHARTAHGGSDVRSWRPATNTALEFGITSGQLTDFDGATISLRRQHGEHAVWRFGCDLSKLELSARTEGVRGNGLRGIWPYGNSRLQLAMRLARITVPWPERRIRPWAGLGFGGGVERGTLELHLSGFDLNTIVRSHWISTAALAGLEYSVTPRFVIHGQYGEEIRYDLTRASGMETLNSSQSNGFDDVSRAWTHGATSTRFGVAVFY